VVEAERVYVEAERVYEAVPEKPAT